MKFKNKRADIAVTILVFLVLFLSLASLFSFVSVANKVEAKISNAGFIEEIYSTHSNLEFNIFQIGENAFIKTYNKFAKDGSYIGEVFYLEKDEMLFNELEGQLNDKFILEFRENFKQGFKDYSSKSKAFNDLKNKVEAGEFMVLFDDKGVSIAVSELEISRKVEDIEISYFPELLVKVNFEKTKFHSFEKVYGVKEFCKDRGDAVQMQSCFNENLDNFNAKVEKKISFEKLDYFSVSLTSKNSFVIGGEFKEIVFKFGLE